MMTNSKACNCCGQTKLFTDFYRDSKAKDGHTGRCKVCDAEYQRANPNRAITRKRSADKYREVRNQRAREKNRQRRMDKYAVYLAEDNAYTKYRAARQLAKATATPTWVSQEDRRKVTDIYAAAAMLQELTCSPYDVDHIVPLQSDVVCGLHVWWNLQAIPQSLNAQKRNIFEPSLYLDQGRVAFPDKGWAVRRSDNALQMEEDDE
jgi:hypothetical protein